ncbi:MAG TPA: hypothetical protein VF152_09735 [Acidimicrobiia bacterium]
MTMIDQRTRPVAPEAPVTPEPVVRADTRAWLRERITAETAVLMAATWWVLFLVATGLEPEATGSAPAWAAAASFAFFGLLGITAVGLFARRRWGLLASLGAAGLLTALSVACPASAHHAIGGWWFGQMACVLGLLGASAFALTRPAAHA